MEKQVKGQRMPVLATSGNLGSSSVTAMNLSSWCAPRCPSCTSICARSGVPGGLTKVSESSHSMYWYRGSMALKATSLSQALCLYSLCPGTCSSKSLCSAPCRLGMSKSAHWSTSSSLCASTQHVPHCIVPCLSLSMALYSWLRATLALRDHHDSRMLCELVALMQACCSRKEPTWK